MFINHLRPSWDDPPSSRSKRRSWGTGPSTRIPPTAFPATCAPSTWLVLPRVLHVWRAQNGELGTTRSNLVYDHHFQTPLEANKRSSSSIYHPSFTIVYHYFGVFFLGGNQVGFTFFFSPRTLGKQSILTSILQMGWNHQLGNVGDRVFCLTQLGFWDKDNTHEVWTEDLG